MTEPSTTSSVIQRDFKNADSANHKLPTRSHWLTLLATIAVLAVILTVVANNASATRHDEPLALTEDRITLPLDLPSVAESPLEDPAEIEVSSIDWRSVTVGNGDNLALIFSRQGLSSQELYLLMSAGKQTDTFKSLAPGQKFRFHIEGDRLQQLVYESDPLTTLQATRINDDQFELQTITREMETRVTNTSGVIESSLFVAGQQAGMSDNLIMQLAGIFGWDIDFALNIRRGDSFTVVYEQKYLDGVKQGDGDIIAAEFINQGQSFRAVRYTGADNRTDYYAPDGESMRKAFLRTPVDFTRISSRFGARKHPISKTWKNHHGVDYAAPTGTPIKAAGDGRIAHLGTKGGYGKTIIIQHGGTYSTLYGHMSRYARGLGPGKAVRQGQVIGYVGSTGASTGPHLHYEFRVNGAHRNPLTVRLPDAAPIAAEFRADFQTKSRSLLALLDVLQQRTTVALNE